MISLTPKQHRTARVIIVAQCKGEKLTVDQLAIRTGLSKSSAFRQRACIRERFGAGGIEAIVPRGPDGKRLRFIPMGERNDG